MPCATACCLSQSRLRLPAPARGACLCAPARAICSHAGLWLTARPRARRNKLLINEYKVDLHGLDAAQAVDALHDTLAKFSGEHSARPACLPIWLFLIRHAGSSIGLWGCWWFVQRSWQGHAAFEHAGCHLCSPGLRRLCRGTPSARLVHVAR